jgi:predicted transcriptional regulator of viral defense system
MKIQSLSSLDSIPYFTIEGVKQLLGEEPFANGTIRTALYRWMKVGLIIQLKNGVYMTRRFFDQHKADLNFSAAVSSILIPQSYISLEYVLQRYGVLTEVTFSVTSITQKNTRVIENEIGCFTYRHIKMDLYNGFTLVDYLGIPFAQASVAKALFDYLYFRPLTGSIFLPSYNLCEDLRLNLDGFSTKDREEFGEFVENARSRKMDKIHKNLRGTVWRP